MRRIVQTLCIAAALWLAAGAAEARFLQTDPVRYQDDLNPYTYVRNDPLNASDPSGRQGRHPDDTSATRAEDRRREAIRNTPSDPPVVVRTAIPEPPDVEAPGIDPGRLAARQVGEFVGSAAATESGPASPLVVMATKELGGVVGELGYDATLGGIESTVDYVGEVDRETRSWYLDEGPLTPGDFSPLRDQAKQ